MRPGPATLATAYRMLDEAIETIDLVLDPQSSVAAPTTNTGAAMLKGSLVNLRRAKQLLVDANA